jgi:hypothetical protein
MDNKSDISNVDMLETKEIDGSNELNLEEKLIIEDNRKKPINKNEQAKELVKNSIELISKADKDIEVTKKTIATDINRLEEIKHSFLNTTFTQSQILLEKASYEYSKHEAKEPFEISLGSTNESIKVKNISSGVFSGFILALLTMIITAGTWIYVASMKAGVTLQLQPPTLPTHEDIEKILIWIGGGMTGANGNPMFGMITIGLSAIILGILVYKTFLSLKESKNFKVANDIYQKSHLYVKQQKESKTEMEKIDEHIKNIIPMVENYKYLLDEQNAKMQRVLHVEGIKGDYSEYHPSSIETMRDTEKLMNRVEELITTPVTKDGKLNEVSEYALYEAKEIYDYYISKIYN